MRSEVSGQAKSSDFDTKEDASLQKMHSALGHTACRAGEETFIRMKF